MQASVIVPTLNSERFLEEALESIWAQAEVEIELVVVDGGSTDGTVGIAEKYRARVIYQTGKGLSDAWNSGIKSTRRSPVALLDSDDVWMPGTLAPRIDVLSRSPEPAICVGAVRHFLADAVERPAGFRPRLFEHDNVVPIPGTMLIDRRVFDRVGWFDTELATAGDADWVARAVNHGIKFCEFERLVLRKRIHDTNLTLDAGKVNSELLEVVRRSIRQKRSSQD